MPHGTAGAAVLRDIERAQIKSVGYLLIRCGQLWNQRAIDAVNAEAGGEGPALREAHTRLFPYLTRPEGVRIIELARALGVTKQAVQPLIAELEAMDIVSVWSDDDDGRARRVHLTVRGAAAFAHGTGILVRIEEQLEGQLDRRLMRRLRNDLARLHDALAVASTPAMTSSVSPARQRGRTRAHARISR